MRGALVILLAPALAAAEPATVARALEAERAGDLAGASALLEQALAEGGNDPDSLRVVWSRLGVLRAVALDAQGAEAAFAAWLVLEPGAALPPGFPPAAVAALDRARAARGEAPALSIRVVAQDPTEAGRPHTAVVHVTGDTAGLAKGARARVYSGPAAGTSVEHSGAPPVRLEFPREATTEVGELRYRVELLDARGSVLAFVGTERSPRVVQVVPRGDPGAPQGTPPPPPDEGSIFGKWWFWGGAAVVIGGTVAAIAAATSGSGVGRVGPPEVVRP